MRVPFLSRAARAAVVLAALTPRAAWAHRVALLPSRGPDGAPSQNALDVELTRGLIALGHDVVPATEVHTALASVADGVADTSEEYGAVCGATKADWVVVGHVEPAVGTQRVEITAYLGSLGRVESVARHVETARSQQQEQEMLAVLLRPEGIGTGSLPWEHGPTRGAASPAPTAHAAVAVTPPAPVPTGPRVVHMDYMSERHDVWPPYSAGRRGFVSVLQGLSGAAARPAGSRGSSLAWVGALRGGFAPGDLGLELFGQLGGNLVGPRALMLDAGVRWMFTPSVHEAGGSLHGLALHVGPAVTLGGFFRLPGPDVTRPDGTRLSGDANVDFSLGAALDVIFSITPSFQVEAAIGNLRWIPTDDGAVLLLGGSLGAGLRL